MTDQDDTSLRPLVPERGAEAARGGSQRAHAAFGAQVLGAGGLRRGLRGGQVVLQAARAAYLKAEWSGDGDRRGSAGLLARHRV